MVLQMWMVLLLGTMIGVGRAQVSTAKVMRGNIRRDGEKTLSLHSAVAVLVACCVYC